MDYFIVYIALLLPCEQIRFASVTLHKRNSTVGSTHEHEESDPKGYIHIAYKARDK